VPNFNYSRFCCHLAAARHHLVAMAAKQELPLDGDASGAACHNLVAMAAKQGVAA